MPPKAKKTASKKGNKEEKKVLGKMTVREFKDMINKQLKGDGRIDLLSESADMFLHRRPSGLLGLDLETAGGIPASAVTEIIGKDGSGKTTLGNMYMAKNQQIYGNRSNMFIAVSEHPYDKKYGRKCGVQIGYSDRELDETERVTGQPFTKEQRAQLKGEQVGEIVELRGATAEILLEMVIQALKSNIFQLGILDSIGNLLPEAVDAGTMEDKHYSGSAAILTQFCNKLGAIQCLPDVEGKPHKTALVIINQYRVVIGGNPKANPMKIQGGHAMMHKKALDIELRVREKLFVGPQGNQKQIGKVIGWKIIKQKIGGSEGASGSFKFMFEDSRPDLVDDACNVAVHVGVIKRAGPYYNWGEQQFLGREKLVEYVKEEDHYEQLQKEVFDITGTQALLGE